MQSWRYHLFYWGASVLSVAGYNAARVTENWNMEIFQVCFAGFFALSIFLYFVLQLYGSLQRTHYVVFAVTFVLGLVAFPHHYVVNMSEIALAVLPVCAFYRVAAGPMAYRGYSEVRYWMVMATLMVSLGALPHPFVAPVANSWPIASAVHALLSFAAIGAIESTRQNVWLSVPRPTARELMH